MSIFQNGGRVAAALVALSLPGCGEKNQQDATVSGLDAARDVRSSLVRMETSLPDLSTMEAFFRSGKSAEILEAIRQVRVEGEKFGRRLNDLERAARGVAGHEKR